MFVLFNSIQFPITNEEPANAAYGIPALIEPVWPGLPAEVRAMRGRRPREGAACRSQIRPPDSFPRLRPKSDSKRYPNRSSPLWSDDGC